MLEVLLPPLLITKFIYNKHDYSVWCLVATVGEFCLTLEAYKEAAVLTAIIIKVLAKI